MHWRGQHLEAFGEDALRVLAGGSAVQVFPQLIDKPDPEVNRIPLSIDGKAAFAGRHDCPHELMGAHLHASQPCCQTATQTQPCAHKVAAAQTSSTVTNRTSCSKLQQHADDPFSQVDSSIRATQTWPLKFLGFHSLRMSSPNRWTRTLLQPG